MTQITKDLRIGEILELDCANEIIPFLLNMGMHCIGCPASAMETIEEACMVHGVDADDLVDSINNHLKEINA